MAELAALGLVANIFAVVDFSLKVISAARETYENGQLEESADLEKIAKDLKDVNDGMKASLTSKANVSGANSKDDTQLTTLADESSKIADDLMQMLGKLKTSGTNRTWQSIRKAILTMWSRDKIESTANRLEKVRDEVQYRIIVSLRAQVDQLSTGQTRSFQTLDNQTKDILQYVLEHSKDSQQRHEQLLIALQSLQNNYTVSVAPTSAANNGNATPQTVDGLLRQLRFSSMTDRRENLAIAHKKTFDWIYAQETSPDSPATGFPEWLENGSSSEIFWIYGKAASGKSTLMKLLTDDQRTYKGLDKWAGDKPLLTASFYFWSNGTPLQRSFNGMLQGLLYELISKDRSLADIAFPGFVSAKDPPPTLLQLQAAFQRLLRHPQLLFKCCFLIDGLDEYEGDNIEQAALAEFFTAVAQSNENVKFIISSRPLNVFDDIFGSYQKLAVHSLTEHDITLYVKDRLVSHPAMADLNAQSPYRASALVENIVHMSQGVFLWVRLVVDRLLSRLRNGTDFEDLNDQLNQLPRDLENLYGHMLSRIEPDYASDASRMIQILRYWDRPMRPLFMHYAFEETEGSAIKYPVGEITLPDAEKRMRQIYKKISSRCLGLIETYHQLVSSEELLDNELFSGEGRDVEQNRKNIGMMPYLDHPTRGYLRLSTVQFVHKSVTDYLERKEVWQKLLSNCTDGAFDPRAAIMNAMLIDIKTDSFSLTNYHTFSMHEKILQYNNIFEAELGKPCSRILEEMNRATTIRLQEALPLQFDPDGYNIEDHWSDYIQEDYSREAPWQDTFLSLAIRSGARLYVEEKISSLGGRLPEKNGRPLLDYAVYPEPAMPEIFDPVSLELVKYLLDHGADPNQKFNNASPWQNILKFAWRRYKRGTPEVKILEIMIALLEKGADPEAVFEVSHRVSKRRWEPRQYCALDVARRTVDGLSDMEASSGLGYYPLPENFPEIKASAARLLKTMEEKLKKGEELNNVVGEKDGKSWKKRLSERFRSKKQD